MLHREARAQLNKITTKASQDGADVIYPIYDTLRWKEYISLHTQYDKIIGCGVTAAHLEAIANTRDPNRAGSARVDYVIYRADNTCCRVHPGNKPKKIPNYTLLISAVATEHCKSTKFNQQTP